MWKRKHQERPVYSRKQQKTSGAYKRNKPINRAQLKFRRFAKKVAHTAAEKKWVDNWSSDNIVSEDGALFSFPYPQQGTEEDQYVGQKVRVSSYALHYTFNLPEAIPYKDWYYMRVIVLEWKMPATIPTLNEILDATTYNYTGAMFQIRDARNFRILYDKAHRIIRIPSGGSQAPGVLVPIHKTRFTRGFTREIGFAMPSSTPINSQLYTLAISNVPLLENPPLFALCQRTRYSDV